MTHPKRCEDLLVEMVGFDTVNAAISGRAAPESVLAEFLAAYAEQFKFSVSRLPVDGMGCNLMISHAVRNDAPWLIFVSHLDTVSAANMTIDPFGGLVRDGRIYGRGACDTKASGAAMLSAMIAYRDGAMRSNNVAVLFTVDEEIGKSGITAFVDRHLPALGFTPAGAIVGEPTDLHAIIAHNGVARWTIRTQGIAAHSSNPGRGRSAISMMVRVIQALELQYVPSLKESNELTGSAQCSINVIHGGTQVNIIPDACRIEIDRRIVPGEDADAILPAVERFLDVLRREDPDLVVVQDPPFVDRPLDPRGNEAFIGFVQSALAGSSLPHEPKGAAFATEASSLSHAGIPAVVLGPGRIEQAHSNVEWVSLDQLNKAMEIYLQIMCRPMEKAR